MGAIHRILAVILTLTIFIGCSEEQKPSTTEVEPLLKAYLIGEKARSCAGTVTVDRISVARIGDYEQKYGGWPVYATFGVTCVEGSSFSVWNNDDTSKTAIVSVVRQKLGGGYECYMPDIFREKDNALSRQMDALPPGMMDGKAK